MSIVLLEKLCKRKLNQIIPIKHRNFFNARFKPFSLIQSLLFFENSADKLQLERSLSHWMVFVRRHAEDSTQVVQSSVRRVAAHSSAAYGAAGVGFLLLKVGAKSSPHESGMAEGVGVESWSNGVITGGSW